MINWAYFSSQFRITHFNSDTMNPFLEFLYPKLFIFALGLLHRFIRKSGSSKGVPLPEEKQDLLNDGFEGKEDENEASEFAFTFKFPSFEEFSKTQKDLSQLGVTREDGFADQECVLEQMVVDGLNLENIVEIEEKEDVYSSCQEKIVDGLNLENIVEVEEKEEVYSSCQEKVIDGLNLKDNVEDEAKEGIYASCQDKVIDGLNLKDDVEVEEKEEIYTSCQDKMMIDGLNLKNIVKVKEKEEIYVSCQHKVIDGLNLKENVEEEDYTSCQENKIDCLNLKNIVEDEVKEEVYVSCQDKVIDGLNLKNIEEDEEIYTSCQDKMIDGCNLKNIVEDEEKEEVYTSCQENLKKPYGNKVYLSPDSPTFDIDLEDGFLSDDYFELDINVEDENEQNKCTRSGFLSEDDLGAKSGNVNGNGNRMSNDTTNKLESLWEHQELKGQLKVEIKKVKVIGLPTIFEEAESPQKIMEDLKPWKIKDVYQTGGGKMGQVHKFYKSYRERMRKFDTFSYQKLYAIGLLQLKDPLESCSSSSVPETTLFTQSLTRNKSKKHENDPTMNFIQELESDLEIVYVGQMCLSWEILRWQYEKALDIWELDPRGVRRFNDIAGEFQQFQVLMQRFIEDEPFQGPRVQNYAKTRCVYRNLLQVPVIRDDHLKNKKARSEVVCDITSDALVDILEESIRIFWQFVRADKYKRHTPVEFQIPEDSQLFLDLQKDLHKKERKLKEQLRGGSHILKKLRCREDETEDEVVYFFCEVDMKLVSRVLQMSKLTSDQLLWCHNKLSKVSFVNRKIHVEPSFLLFPC